jgi:hypothetical protein
VIRQLLVITIILFSLGDAIGQFKRLSLKEEELASRTRGWTDGFNSRISGQTFADTLVANCSQSTIQWKSAPVKKVQKNQLNYLITPIKIDLTSRKNKVILSINGVERFIIPSNNKRDWILKGPDRSTLEFQYFDLDDNNDAIGYLIAGLPGEWLSKGEAVSFGATLECSGTVGWFKVIQNPNTLSSLRSKAEAESWIDVKLTSEGKSQSMEVVAPPEYSGKMFEYLIGNSIRGRKQAIIREGRAYVKLTIKNSKANTDGMSLELFANEESLFQFPDIYKKKTVEKQEGDILTEMEGGMYLGKTWTLEVRTLYRPQ